MVIQDLVCHEMVDCVLIFHQMRKVEKRCCNFYIEVFINK